MSVAFWMQLDRYRHSAAREHVGEGRCHLWAEGRALPFDDAIQLFATATYGDARESVAAVGGAPAPSASARRALIDPVLLLGGLAPDLRTYRSSLFAAAT